MKKEVTPPTNEKGGHTTHQCEKHHEAGDVPDHTAQGDLQRSQHLKRWHQPRGPREADDVGDSEERIRHDFWVIRLPLEACCTGKSVKT